MLTHELRHRQAAASPAAAPANGVPRPIQDVPSREHALKRRRHTPPIGEGSRLGRYVIGAQLGSGGMGVVYAAFDTCLARRVAIKILKDRVPASIKHARDRLLREAQALARLSHPNVIALHDFGNTADGVYLAMELVVGPNISEWVKKREPSWELVVDRFAQAGMGLAAAHEAGIIHRDFKPTNVIVGNDGRVRVLDFGLARALVCDQPFEEDAEKDDDYAPRLLSTRLTDVNVVLGTTGYIAPEQLLGKPASTKSDQFAFCVALFEALYGKRPFPGRSVIEIANRFRHGKPETIADRKGVPARVHRVLQRGLAIDPNERYESMDDLLAALREAATRRKRSLFPAAAAAVVLASSVAYFAGWVTEPPKGPIGDDAMVCAPASSIASDTRSETSTRSTPGASSDPAPR